VRELRFPLTDRYGGGRQFTYYYSGLPLSELLNPPPGFKWLLLPIGPAQAVMGWRYSLGFRQVPNCKNRTVSVLTTMLQRGILH
jgi:hypothetical protein